MTRTINARFTLARLTGLVAATFALAGFASAPARADGNFPTKHKGLKVEKLAVVPEASMNRQIGIEGRILLARRITIQPGGHIAKHSAATVPAIVYMESGAWVEGREGGETVHSAGDTFIEDADTVHWFYNRGDEPASALVFDIKPAG